MRKTLFVILIFCAYLSTRGQTFTPPSFADIDSNYRNYVNNVFGALEANRVPTGLLLDYGFDFADPRFYNGIVLADSTLMEQGIYGELYKTIFTSKFNNNAGNLRHPSIHDSLCYIARQKQVITLSGLFFKYNAIDPNAQANGKMQTVNGRLRDRYVSGIWQNPYEEFTTLAISPSVIKYSLNSCNLLMPSNLFLSNRSNEISSIQLDAGDGQGYRTISFDVLLPISYSDSGWKHWKFKLNLTNGQQLYSHAKIYFDNNSAGSGSASARSIIVDRQETIVASEQFQGVSGIADIKISYRNALDPVLRKPLIVAEGFDPGWITDPEEPEGINTFIGFIRKVRNSSSSSLRSLISDNPSQYDIVYVNWRNGTDWLQRNALVLEEVIRWVNSQKQPDLQTGQINPNILLGSSMGGVIARMALGRMDRSGGYPAHQTGLYVSIDAPHQGANVPLGYQALARHATRMYVSTGPLALAVEAVQLIFNQGSTLQTLLLADQPAAKQMLLNRIDVFYNQDNSTNHQFLQELRTQWAYPTGIRCIAISNGSECAIDQEFTSGSTLFYHYRSTKTRLITDIFMMAAGGVLAAVGTTPAITIPLLIPGSSKFELTLDIKSLASNGGNNVYYGNIKLTKKVLWLASVSINLANKTYTAPSGLLPLDGYPGGFYTVTINNQPGAVSQDWMFSYNNSFSIVRRFCFIPTTSALDIGQGNTLLTNVNFLAKYVGGNPPLTPFNSPFVNFATAYNSDPLFFTDQDNTWSFLSQGNEDHEAFYRRTSDWLANEINGVTTVRTNCEAFCTNGVIAGNTTICGTETFTAPFGVGATYNWTVDNGSLVSIVPSGNSVVVTRNGSAHGQTTLRVNISGACRTLNLFLPIYTGTVANGYFIINSNYHQLNQRQLFENNSPIWLPANQGFGVTAVINGGNANSFSWSRQVASYPFNWSGTGSTLNFSGNAGSTAYNQRNGVFTLTAQNACGTISTNYTWPVIVQAGSFRIAASPNPASSSLNVNFLESASTEASVTEENVTSKPSQQSNSKGKTIVTLYAFDTGTRIKQWIHQETKSKTYSVNVSGLKKGIYVLQVDRDDQTASTKIVIE